MNGGLLVKCDAFICNDITWIIGTWDHGLWAQFPVNASFHSYILLNCCFKVEVCYTNSKSFHLHFHQGLVLDPIFCSTTRTQLVWRMYRHKGSKIPKYGVWKCMQLEWEISGSWYITWFREKKKKGSCHINRSYAQRVLYSKNTCTKMFLPIKYCHKLTIMMNLYQLRHWLPHFNPCMFGLQWRTTLPATCLCLQYYIF